MSSASPLFVHDPGRPELGSSLLRALLDATPEIIYFKDRDSRFIAVSRAKAQRHGLEPGELLGKTDADLFPPEIARQARAEEEAILATGEPSVGGLTRIRLLHGGDRWVRVAKYPLRDASGAIVGTVGQTHDVTDEQTLAVELEKTRRDLVEASRQAGMAEVATGVLHNVGNVLTSLNVSANVLMTGLRQSKADTLGKLAALLQEHTADLGEFLTNDSKGRRVPEFLDSLAQHMAAERERLLRELASLQANIDHIKEIIVMQQAYATTVGVVEPLDAAALAEDALRMNAGALQRHAVTVLRDYHPIPKLHGEKGKVLQILVNLIRNAKYACDEGGAADKMITLRIVPGAPGRAQIIVADNGVGIPPENLPRLFQHGFTTRADGHGFGLHSARQVAAELNGVLTVHSDGPGRGATFTLDLPTQEPAPAGSAATEPPP